MSFSPPTLLVGHSGGGHAWIQQSLYHLLPTQTISSSSLWSSSAPGTHTLPDFFCVLMSDSPALLFRLFSWLRPCLSCSCPGKLLIFPSDFACSLAVPVGPSSSHPATCSFLRIIDLWDYFLEFLDTVLTLCFYMDRLLPVINHWESSSVVCVLQQGPASAYDT